MKVFVRTIRISLVLLIICGLIYPLTMTGISQLILNKQANGSILSNNGKEVGSELLGQNFTDPRFFHGRISSVDYNTYAKGSGNSSSVSSGSDNLAPTSKKLYDRVQNDIAAFLKANPGVKKEDIPEDLLTSSGSGLDPDLSPAAARIQIPGISKATAISTSELENLVSKYTEGRELGIFGEPRVNVLKLNIEISNILGKK